jgi:hypothetical protein
MADIPDFIECGESGSGELADSAEGVRSRDFDLKAILSAPGLVGYDAAEAFALTKFPLLRRGHRRTNVRVDPIGGGYWVATAHYSNSSLIVRRGGEKAVRFSSWEWETSEKSEKITQALLPPLGADENPVNQDPNWLVDGYIRPLTVGDLGGPYPPGNQGIPDFRGAIGIDGDNVNGVQKPFSVFNWNETWIYPAEWIDGKRPARVDKNADGDRVEVSQQPLTNVIEDNCFFTNEKVFRGKPPGCILLTGVRSSRMNLGASSVSVTFSFSYSPLRENFKVGDILIATKDGWDYMDIYYDTESSGNELVKKAKYVYVCRIFGRMDFLDLGLPEDRPRWYLDEDMPSHVIGTPFGE